ncbi:MAG: winged helix-turn-helix transcriptional regulator [Promethearchaeota archaeon]
MVEYCFVLVRFLSIDRLAYLSMIRNVKRGLLTRTDILKHLDSEIWTTTSVIAQQVSVTRQTVIYHLRNLEREDVVERDTEGKGWRFGPFQQSELSDFFATKRKSKKK